MADLEHSLDYHVWAGRDTGAGGWGNNVPATPPGGAGPSLLPGVPPKTDPVIMLPAGSPPIPRSGKRQIPENANCMSNTDTVVWGRDLDGSSGQQTLMASKVNAGAAGHVPRAEKMPAWGW